MKKFKFPKELQVAIVVIFFSLLTYYLVEPFAHSQMHKHVEGNNFNYDGKDDILEIENSIKAKEEKIIFVTKEMKDTNKSKKQVFLIEINKLAEQIKDKKTLKEEKEIFWTEVNKLSEQKANVNKGKEAFSVCSSCHNGTGVPMGGVVPPNLDYSGYLYDKKYLIALLKNPVMASNKNHKYDNYMSHPMASAYSMIGNDQKLIDIVAYLLESKAKIPTPKQAFKEACSRCHSMRYAKTTILGTTPKFKLEEDALAYRIKVIKAEKELTNYLGTKTPDLSTIIRARTHHYLKTFVENPQSQIKSTSMPRVGLTEDAYTKVEEYLVEVGDPHKEDRDNLGIWVILYFFIFTIIAYIWKKEKWKEV